MKGNTEKNLKDKGQVQRKEKLVEKIDQCKVSNQRSACAVRYTSQ